MNDQHDLSRFAASAASFQYEAYVMSYLRALSEQPIYGGDYPLNLQLHLLPTDAHVLLRNPSEVEKLEKLLNCKKEEVFERLRDLIDEWDGVRVPDSVEVSDLVDADWEALLLGNEGSRFAARYLNCSPEGVLGTLFDASQIYNDLIAVAGGARFANNDVYKLLRYLASQPNLQQKIKSNLYLRDWWEVLETWVRPNVGATLAATLTQQTEHPVSKAYALRELYRLVKLSLSAGATPNKPQARYIQSTRLGMILPEETSKFWHTLREFSEDANDTLKLDGLEQDSIAKNSIEANVKEALRIADSYMQTYVQPIQHELGQVDMLGIIALKHRFQGIVEELLSNALHYASLDSDMQNALSYIHDAIRYYCHGEYKIALTNFLDVSFLSLEQMRVACKVANRNLDVERDTPIVIFTAEDNSFLGLGFLKSTVRPPRNVAEDELLIALQFENRSIEILCLDQLNKTQINEIKIAFPKTVGGLIDNGQSLAERMMKTPIAVSTDRKKINDVLKEQVKFLVPALVLSGSSFALGRLIPAADVFNRIPKALPSDKTLEQTHSLDSLAAEIISSYQKEGMKVSRISGA